MDHSQPNRHRDASPSDQPTGHLAGLLPWGVSLAIHAVLVSLAMLIIAAVATEPKTEAGVNVAHATPELITSMQVDLATLDVEPWTTAALEPESQFTPVDALLEPVMDVIDIDAAGHHVIAANGSLSLQVNHTLAHNTDEAKRVADLFALPSSAAQRPRGSSARAARVGPFDLMMPTMPADQPRRVVYLVDASGSLVDTFAFVTDELARSIATLPAGDLFTVIVCRDGQVLEPRPLGLKEATPMTRLEVAGWVQSMYAAGRSDMTTALERALSYRPDDIVLISDHITSRGLGVEQRQQAQNRLLDVIAHTSRGTRIHTIQMLYRDPLTLVSDREGTLATIARQTDGQHLFLREMDLFSPSSH